MKSMALNSRKCTISSLTWFFLGIATAIFIQVLMYVIGLGTWGSMISELDCPTPSLESGKGSSHAQIGLPNKEMENHHHHVGTPTPTVIGSGDDHHHHQANPTPTPQAPAVVVPEKKKGIVQKPVYRDNETMRCTDLGPGSTQRPANAAKQTIVLDYILFNQELDILEVRLNTLKDVVDYFIIVESAKTFSGLAKPLVWGGVVDAIEKYNKKNRRDSASPLEDRAETVVGAQFESSDPETLKWAFEPLLKKVIHVVIDESTDEVVGVEKDKTTGKVKDGWDREHLYRKVGLDLGLKRLVEQVKIPEVPLQKDASWDTKGSEVVVVMADLDEIPRPALVRALKSCDGYADQLAYETMFYYYSYQYRQYGSDWGKSKIARITSLSSPPNAESLRTTGGFHTVPLAGWHCTWCFPLISDVRLKMKSYSHFEHNLDAYLQERHIVDHFRFGFDLFDRGGLYYYYIEENEDVPGHVERNPERFAYMLDRRNEYAGFLDLKK
ncbi:hypothetical protein HDV05_004784 [Chytridiales sp. JEL 0842]|nr:hypothetical protein HDV05_004784 [Chytridiales sp. JEL 0842]